MAGEIIKTTAVGGTGFEERWNISVVEYQMPVDGKNTKVDFQDLMVNVAENQALAIEQEVQPQAIRVKKRTERLKICGDAMAEISVFKFDTKDSANPMSTNTGKISEATAKILTELTGTKWVSSTGGAQISKASADSANQYLKSESDKLNNQQQLSMSRLESLVQSRDQNFNMASTLMTHVSETRGNTIKSFG